MLAIAGASMFAWLGPLSRWAGDAGMEQLAFVAWRAGVGALVLVIVVALRHRTRAMRRPATRELWVLAAATLVALVLALVGMAVVVAGGFDPSAGGAIDLAGVALALVAAAAQTVFVTISRRGYPGIPADQAIAVILGGTFIGCVAIGVLAAQTGQLSLPFGRPELLAIVVVSGTLGAAVPSFLFLSAIRLIGGMRTGILMLFEPVVAVTLAAILLHEAIRPIQVLGAVGVLGAAIVLRRSASGEPDDRTISDDEELLGVGLTGGP